ncbi:cob(I)yrinic acid a,c-diamide adenosyltransferase [candidate division WWE3 bacterium]|uniref:Corrinoid adenosyltransferase n=1 Tax=candidate division WWE3 bacterium TaxID=2053526 RepID=A0A955LKR0_UNCKA|nr:cob(I)yrinic acid a,c-diamide adenosyltransferase [candidate division WWE3 bacterium]
MSIYTKKGDKGTTALVNNQRIPKTNLRVSCIGTVDELNANVGLTISLLAHIPPNRTVQEILLTLQHTLLQLGSSIAGSPLELDQQVVANLEQIIDHYQVNLPPLSSFVLPGGTKAAAACHMSRTVCRRCERMLVALSSEQKVDPIILQFINRLSDLLFVLARVINRNEGEEDVLWVKNLKATDDA